MGNIFQWGPTSPKVFGDPADPLFAARYKAMLGQLKAYGAKAVRCPGPAYYDLIAPLFDEMGMERAVVLAYNSLWQRTDLAFEARVDRWLRWAERMLARWMPDYVLPDVERNSNPEYFRIEKCPGLPWRLDAMVRKHCGYGTPILWYNGADNIGRGAGDHPAPRFYQVWRMAAQQGRSPVDIMEELIAKYPVLGGYPWISFERDAWNKHGMPGWIFDDDTPESQQDAVDVAKVLKAAGALGVCLYNSPNSAGLPPGNPRLEKALETMALVDDVFD